MPTAKFLLGASNLLAAFGVFIALGKLLGAADGDARSAVILMCVIIYMALNAAAHFHSAAVEN